MKFETLIIRKILQLHCSPTYERVKGLGKRCHFGVKMKNGENGIEVGGWGIWKGVEWGGWCSVGRGWGVWCGYGVPRECMEISGRFLGTFRENSENSGVIRGVQHDIAQRQIKILTHGLDQNYPAIILNSPVQYLKSRDFLNVGKNVQYTPFGTLTSDNTYVYSDTGNISFSTFVRLLR